MQRVRNGGETCTASGVYLLIVEKRHVTGHGGGQIQSSEREMFKKKTQIEIAPVNF